MVSESMGLGFAGDCMYPPPVAFVIDELRVPLGV
jgi:hypothetical protein